MGRKKHFSYYNFFLNLWGHNFPGFFPQICTTKESLGYFTKGLKKMETSVLNSTKDRKIVKHSGIQHRVPDSRTQRKYADGEAAPAVASVTYERVPPAAAVAAAVTLGHNGQRASEVRGRRSIPKLTRGFARSENRPPPRWRRARLLHRRRGGFVVVGWRLPSTPVTAAPRFRCISRVHLLTYLPVSVYTRASARPKRVTGWMWWGGTARGARPPEAHREIRVPADAGFNLFCFVFSSVCFSIFANRKRKYGALCVRCVNIKARGDRLPFGHCSGTWRRAKMRFWRLYSDSASCIKHTRIWIWLIIGDRI